MKISDSSYKKKNALSGIASGVFLLSLSTFAVKIIGLAYKIPMLSLLGAEGMGYFNSAYEIYALMCVISTSGLPTALSILISSYNESKNINKQITDSVKLMIGTTKVYSTLRKKKDVLCYEEREWRVIHSDNGMTKWGWGLKDRRTKKAYNNRLHSNSDLAYLSFIIVEDSESAKIVEENFNKLITHILVQNEAEIPVIAEFIMDENNTIFGYALSKKCRLLLISKLNSFERLSKDY